VVVGLQLINEETPTLFSNNNLLSLYEKIDALYAKAERIERRIEKR